jgi:2-C-methyl-D-erythritol 2,4-cyclodiphosphate synthase
MRIGFGYDLHKLVSGRKLILGGIEVPFNKGLLGHSDADVLLHAITDALLGAAGLGDIGEHFPDTDKQYKDISSAVLLQKAFALINKEGFTIGNIDAVIVLEKPKLSAYKEKMREKIAQILNIPKANVNVKAKTNEGLDSVGKGKAIAVYAIALLSKGGIK